MSHQLNERGAVGQLIEVEPVVLGDVVVFDTDRSLSGQDGETFSSADEAAASTTFSAVMAAALLSHDSSLSSVYVYSNAISVKRSGGWSDDAVAAAVAVIRNALIHYDENRH